MPIKTLAKRTVFAAILTFAATASFAADSDLSLETAWTAARAVAARAADGEKQRMLDEALRKAASYSNVAEIQRLVKLGANPNADSTTEMTPLSLAASQYGNPDAVEALIALGADVRQKGLCGMTALHDAAFTGHLDAAKVLVAHRAEIDAVACLGLTPLIQAADWGHADVVAYLLQAGANSALADVDGKTPLMFAARIEVADHLAAFKSLLADPRAQVNARDSKGMTALKYAVKADSLNYVKLLLAVPGIDVNDNAGEVSALFLAEMDNRQDLADLLRKAGAKDAPAAASR